MYLRKDILISNSFSYVTVLFPLLRWIKANSIESLTKGEYFFQFKVKLNFFSLVFLVECLFLKVREHKVHLNFRLKEQPSGQAHSFVLFSLFFFFRKTISRFWSCCLRKVPKEIEISCRLKIRHLLLVLRKILFAYPTAEAILVTAK